MICGKLSRREKRKKIKQLKKFKASESRTSSDNNKEDIDLKYSNPISMRFKRREKKF